MSTNGTSFNAGVLAAVASILGVAFLFSAMLAYMSGTGEEFLLLSGSPWVTVTVGIMLALTGGLLGTGYRQGRFIGTISFGAVVVFGNPLGATDPIMSVAIAAAFLAMAYMIFRNPVPKPEQAPIDESDSAQRFGSTLR